MGIVVEALLPSIDNEININSVNTVKTEGEKKTVFQKIFSSGKTKKDEKKKQTR